MAKREQLTCEVGNHSWTRIPTRGRKPVACPKHKVVKIVAAPKPKSASGKTVLHCQIGNHDWEREPTRGRQPINCPEHVAQKPNQAISSSGAKIDKLHCELGNHEWERESARGRKPANCPQHAPVKIADPNDPPKRKGRPKLYDSPEEQKEAQLEKSRQRSIALEGALKERGTHLSQQDPYRLMRLTGTKGKGKKLEYLYEFIEEHSPLRKAVFIETNAAAFDNQQYRYERHGKVIPL